MLERRLSRRSVVAYDDVVQPFTLLLRAISDDDMVANRMLANPIGFLTENRLETWIVDALRPPLDPSSPSCSPAKSCPIPVPHDSIWTRTSGKSGSDP